MASQDADTQKTQKKKHSTAKGKFHRILNRFDQTLETEQNETVLSQIFKDLNDAYSEIESRHSDYLDTLDSDSESDSKKMSDLSAEMSLLYNELCSARMSMARIKKSQPVIITPTDREVNSLRREASSHHSGIRVKKLEAPTFSGNVRDYPSFKHDFETHMMSSFGKDPFALKRCLTGEALMTVKGVDNDYEEMFERLDLKYGRPEKIADAVLSELKGLKRVQEGEYGKFISMVDIVERCWLDLKRMDLEGEMNTATMISQIEKLLPPVQKREWSIRRQRPSFRKYVDFPEFLSFLLQEKHAIEYMESDLRVGSGASTAYRNKVHSIVASGDVEDFSTTPNTTDGVIYSLQNQIHQNQKIMQQVVEGLAQVAQVVSNNKQVQLDNLGAVKPNATRRRCWYHDTDTHEIGNCSAFAELDSSTKLDVLKRNGGCFSCLKPGHVSRRCYNRKPCDLLDKHQQRCGKMHHPSLHDTTIEITSLHNAVDVNSGQRREGILLMISRIICKNQPVTTLWDPGANMSLISHRVAKKLGLKGKIVSLSMTKVGNVTETIQSKEYIVPMTDASGRTWDVRAYGMDDITADVPQVDVSAVARLFKGIRTMDIARPTGKVDMLIGTDCCRLLPNKVEQIGNLRLMKNQFGFCVRGSHPSLVIPTDSTSSKIRVHFVTGQIMNVNDVQIQRDIPRQLNTFFDIESLGTNCVPKCGGCKCGKCPVGGKDYTIEEERDMILIKQGLKHDGRSKRWTVEYPWKRDPWQLPNNYPSALARLTSTENRLRKAGSQYSKAYQDQITDMVERGVARKLSAEELQLYRGPVHYIPHHEVLKPNSKSTPIRKVFNSSASYMGHVLNDYWAKGPYFMNNMLAVLLRFRQNNVALAGDISKMYNSVKLSNLDQHTHRFLWRNLECTDIPPDHYVLLSVPFGDRPSGAIATFAMHQTAAIQKNEYPEASDMILRNSYVDDLLQSLDSIDEAKRIASGAEKLLDYGGFVIKHWIISGGKESDNETIANGDELKIMDPEQEKVLGMVWKPQDDIFKFDVKINFSPKRRKINTSKDLTKSEIEDHTPKVLTRRIVLSQVASVFDPLGLVIPYILAAKVLLRELCMRRTDCASQEQHRENWDEALSSDMRDRWVSFFIGLFDLECLEFHRCLKPSSPIGDPILIIFSDASSVAYGACAYIRWKVSSDSYEANLIMAKNRIAPIRHLTTPRLELCGAVLSSRLRNTIVKEMDFRFERVVHIVDSRIVRAQIQRQSYGFGTFVATRIAEIQDKSQPSEWWWAPGEDNPADLTTRVTGPQELGYNSLWQHGPEYLRRPIEVWPISQDCDIETNQLPYRIGVSVSPRIHSVIATPKTPKLDDIKLENFSSFNKLLRVTSVITKISKSKSFRSISDEITADDMACAESLWIKYIQSDLPRDWHERYRRLGPSVNNEGLAVVGKRMANWLKANWNQSEFVLLPHESPFTILYVTSIHNRDHAGVDVTMAKVRRKYWVRGLRKLVKRIKDQCVLCKKLNKLAVGQEMENLPIERLQPSPPFHFAAVDLFGPFTIKDTVKKKRTHGKAYGVLFNCLSSRAVYVDLAEGYDTDSFLMVLRRFVSIRGYPRKMISDAGSQLISAAKELHEITKKWDWRLIQQYGQRYGMTWEIIKSADAPWENGCSEALIKSVKRNITVVIGSSIISFSELQTVLFEVANLLNERPIGTTTSDPNEGSYLCPNDLILGRSSSSVPVGYWDEKVDLKRRWRFVQQVVNSFWRKWNRDYFPTLIIRQKWHTSKRNLQVGDVVMVQDQNVIRGHWKLAQVTEAEPGTDGKVRDVVIRYKIQGPGSKYN